MTQKTLDNKDVESYKLKNKPKKKSNARLGKLSGNKTEKNRKIYFLHIHN